jgi:hypothetical protein
MARLSLALALTLAAACTSDPQPVRGSYGMSGAVAGPAQPATAAPEMDPGRKVSEQDCSGPVDLFAGNLRCK